MEKARMIVLTLSLVLTGSLTAFSQKSTDDQFSYQDLRIENSQPKIRTNQINKLPNINKFNSEGLAKPGTYELISTAEKHTSIMGPNTLKLIEDSRDVINERVIQLDDVTYVRILSKNEIHRGDFTPLPTKVRYEKDVQTK